MNGSCRQCQLFFLMNKLRDLRIADFPYLGAAKLRKKLVLQDRFIIGKSTVLDGIADFLHKHSREVTGMLFHEITVEEFAEIRAREAYADGEKAGREEGRSEGAAQEKREIAKNFKDSGIPIDVIAKNTGLTQEEIAAL